MKVHVTIETGDGERIVELDREEVLQAILSPAGLESAVSSFEDIIHLMILSPLRGSLRAKILQLLEMKGFTRITPPSKTTVSPTSFGNEEDRKAFMERIRQLAAHTHGPIESVGDHNAAALTGTCER